jgi:hypothetical protein
MIISGGTTEILKMYKSNYSAAVSVAEKKGDVMKNSISIGN